MKRPPFFISGQTKHKPYPIDIPDSNILVTPEVLPEARYKYVEASPHKIIIGAPYLVEYVFPAYHLIAVVIEMK